MKPSLVLLPMDDRPVNYDYPRYLARLAGYELHLPSRDWLGNPWRQSQHALLVDWLVKAAISADVLVISIDTLAYGGLIPSRTSREDLDSVLHRLTVLKEIKAKRPGLPIFASSVIQRISRANSSEEEKDYWASYGSLMFRLSYLEHKTSLGVATSQEKKEREQLSRKIPQEVITDYKQGRQRNHQVNLTMINWLADGVFNFLLLPQDDTAEYGWNIAEARRIQASIRQKNLTHKAITYPGADEIGCLLLASAACSRWHYQPRVYPRYSSIQSSLVTTAYEDRPIHELIKAHLTPLGGTIASSPEEADIILYLNAPSFSQGEASFQWLCWKGLDAFKSDSPSSIQSYLKQVESDPGYQDTRREMETSSRSPEEFARSLLAELKQKRAIALADVAFVNGADLILGNLLTSSSEILHLSAYGGWNTAGNTLGTVLAHAVLRELARCNGADAEQMAAHYEFLFLRLLDDYYYQAIERSKCMFEDLPSIDLQPTMERLPSPYLDQMENRVRQRLSSAARQLEKLFLDAGIVQSIRVDRIHLPWQRLFEVSFEVLASIK
jgi:hypothetical protein